MSGLELLVVFGPMIILNSFRVVHSSGYLLDLLHLLEAFQDFLLTFRAN